MASPEFKPPSRLPTIDVNASELFYLDRPAPRARNNSSTDLQDTSSDPSGTLSSIRNSLSQPSNISPSKPTIVLVQGAWHSPDPFADNLTPYLESNGYKALTPRLPSMHKPDLTTATLDDDITCIRDCLLTALETSDTILVTHSYGTAPASVALQSLDTTTRTQNNHTTSITAFLIIAGLLIPAGKSLLDFFEPPSTPAPAHGVSNDGLFMTPKLPPGSSYWPSNDYSPNAATRPTLVLVPQAPAVNKTPIPFNGASVVPTRYLICEKEDILPRSVQRLLVDRARDAAREAGRDGEEGEWVKADTIESAYCPILKGWSEKVGEWVRRGAGEERVGSSEGFGTY